MKQYEYVIKAMEENGGYATLGQLYQLVDVSGWKTRTPFATIRRIVQDDRFFFRIKPGLWALKSYRNNLPENIIGLKEEQKKSFDKEKMFTHYYYQGIISEIGNINQFNVFIPAQDKNRPYLNRKLSDVSSLNSLPEFTFSTIIKKIKSVDVIWINERQFPNTLFEVENTTDFKNALSKFYEVIDFATDMIIVADKKRFGKFKSTLDMRIYREIKDRVIFCDYSSLDGYHSYPYTYTNFKNFIKKNEKNNLVSL